MSMMLLRSPACWASVLADVQALERVEHLALGDDAVAGHHPHRQDVRVRTGLADQAGDERAVAGVRIEHPLVRVIDDAGPLRVGGRVVDADRHPQ